MNEHIQQAAQILGMAYDRSFSHRYAAEDLADAGLLVTPEQRAVLDAAEACVDANAGPLNVHGLIAATAQLVATVDALRAATPKDGE